MQLNNEFLVEASTEDTWKLLTDLERVAPCLPGAAMNGRDGDSYLGTVKIKVGPVSANFQGTARFVDQDDKQHTATISMAGKDAKGAASANAVIRARLEPVSGSSTRVYVDTDLDITGRMAQFGRGAIADVSNRLIGQFTDNLSAEITRALPPADSLGGGSPVTGGSPASPAGSDAAPTVPGDLNLLAVLGPTVAKQAAGPLVGFVLGWLVARAFRSERR